MEENKDLNTEKEAAEKATEELSTPIEAVDKAGFADVNYEEEEVKEETEKRAKSGIFGIIIAALAVVAIVVMLLFKFAGGSSDEGLANRYNNGIGVTKGNYLYHSNLSGDTFYKTELNKETLNQEKIGDISASFFAYHKGEVYYYDNMNGAVYKLNEEGEDSLVYQGEGYYHQYVGKYIYFMTPETNYGGFVRRVSLDSGEDEIVLNVPTPCYAISENNIVYYDPQINSLLITTIKNAMDCTKAANGEAMNSSDIKAVVLAKRQASNIYVKGKDVYFTDSSAGNIICHVDMRTGEITEINKKMQGMRINVYKDYMFYIGADNSLCRMNLDGSDIRSLTGKVFKEIGGFAIYGENIVYFAILPRLNSETMQTEYEPVIGVMTIDGESILLIPAEQEDTLAQMMEEMEIQDETEGAVEEAPAEEAPSETEG